MTMKSINKPPTANRKNTMKAILYTQYGPPDVLQLQEIAKPVVSDDDILVKVCAASANARDWHFMRGEPYIMRLFIGLLRPKVKVLGADVAGEVEAVGKNVTQFHPGDPVFGAGNGNFAEYICVSEDSLVHKPANLTFEQAATAHVAAIAALQGLRDYGQLQPGQKVLINGASGGVGTFAVQIAKAFGAEVTGVCSTRNVERLRSLGADWVIDYTQADFTQGQHHYDLIFDLVGNHSLSECKRVMAAQGIYLVVGGPTGGRWLGPIAHEIEAHVGSLFIGQKVVSFTATRNKADLLVLKELLEAGKVTPVIDRHYQLSEVPEAIRYLEAGHAQGKVVIIV